MTKTDSQAAATPYLSGGPSPSGHALDASPFSMTARGERASRRPVWFMRQAGRSLPEYLQARAGIPMLESCFIPELVCEITLQPVRRHDVDAAILFSDIVTPLKAAGVELDIVSGVGPVVEHPIRTQSDVSNLPSLAPDQLGEIAESVRLITAELTDRPLIGFAGAPFTLASYLVEGGPSRHHEVTKSLMHSEPQLWDALLAKLVDITTTFLEVQLDAGVRAVQLFDSWAGALSEADYRRFVLPHSKRVFDAIADCGVPRIHFGVGTGELLTAMAETDADIVGADWRVPIDIAARRIGAGKGVQGNLDPALLCGSWDPIEAAVRRICDEGDRAVAQGATGHIFNLGHGVIPRTNPDVLTRVVELVHSL